MWLGGILGMDGFQIVFILLQVLADVMEFPFFQKGIEKIEEISIHHRQNCTIVVVRTEKR